MHQLDPNTLFSIFEKGDDEIYKEHNMEELLHNPYVLIGMVVTGVENYYLMDKLYCLRHLQPYSKVREGVKLRYFVKLYNYLDTVHLNEFNNCYTIGSSFEINRALDALIDLQMYFQDLEHYEKCSVIKKYVDLLINKKLEELI